jgi:uncharacterized protein (DUF1330 family)
MAAYIIVELDVLDRELFEEYKRLTPPTLAAYGGRFLVRGGAVESLEGDWLPERLVVVEFEDSEKARRWWDSPEYAEAKRLRQRCARTRMVLAEGA